MVLFRFQPHIPSCCFYFCHNEDRKMSAGSWGRDKSSVLWAPQTYPQSRWPDTPSERDLLRVADEILRRSSCSVCDSTFSANLRVSHQNIQGVENPKIRACRCGLSFRCMNGWLVIPRGSFIGCTNADLLASCDQSLEMMTKSCVYYSP